MNEVSLRSDKVKDSFSTSALGAFIQRNAVDHDFCVSKMVGEL